MVPAAYSILLLLVAGVSRFAILSNDSFPLWWQASHLSFHDPGTFYNGFFPIGYPLLLRIAGIAHNPFVMLEVLQILLASIYFQKSWALMRTSLGPRAAFIALISVVFFPQLVRAEFSAVPDFFAALFALLAFDKFTDNGRYSDRMAGVYLGLGLLVRTHILILTIAILLAVLLGDSSTRRERITYLLMGVIPFVVLQGLIQVWSGHSFFENEQAFNVWKTMHGVDWTNPPGHFSATVFQVIGAEPSLFLHTYVSLVWSELYIIIPLAAYLIVARRGNIWQEYFIVTRRNDIWWEHLKLLSLAALFYVFFTIPGGSSRSVLLVVPIVIVDLFVLLRSIIPSHFLSNSRIGMVLPLLAAAVLVAGTFMFLGARDAARRVITYNDLQQALNLTRPGEASIVYSDDFALYFPELRDAVPRRTGGWAELGLPRYLREYPHIPDSSAGAFYAALRQDHIQYAVFRNPPIDKRALEYARIDTLHFVPLPFDGPFAVYRVK